MENGRPKKSEPLREATARLRQLAEVDQDYYEFAISSIYIERAFSAAVMSQRLVLKERWDEATNQGIILARFLCRLRPFQRGLDVISQQEYQNLEELFVPYACEVCAQMYGPHEFVEFRTDRSKWDKSEYLSVHHAFWDWSLLVAHQIAIGYYEDQNALDYYGVSSYFPEKVILVRAKQNEPLPDASRRRPGPALSQGDMLHRRWLRTWIEKLGNERAKAAFRYFPNRPKLLESSPTMAGLYAVAGVTLGTVDADTAPDWTRKSHSGRVVHHYYPAPYKKVERSDFAPPWQTVEQIEQGRNATLEFSWDRSSMLWTDGPTIIKQFSRIADSQFAILDAFETTCWQSDQPVPVQLSGRQKSSAIAELNKILDSHGARLKFTSVRGENAVKLSRIP